MGQEIRVCQFSAEDHHQFKSRLRDETKILKHWFDHQEFDPSLEPCVGLEVEAWLVDHNRLPFPGNDQFLTQANHPLLVHELSQFNFEINVDPVRLGPGSFHNVHQQLRQIWQLCQKSSQEIQMAPLLIGILPTLRDEMLSLDYMTKSNRYRALNEQLFALRNGIPLRIDIKGRDHLNLIKHDLMLEAAATSVQVHLQVPPHQAQRHYNASLIASAPLVALTANSPFLYGHELWDETRIPVFEQAVHVASFRNLSGEDVGRVTFGNGYARHSLLELFLENLDGYPVILPLLFEGPQSALSHLKLQNGTIWRWNRPIVGQSADLRPHLRIEHRVMASGPTLVDIIANMVFCVGLAYHLAESEIPPEEVIPFSVCRDNFYTCAKHGLSAKIQWMDQSFDVQDLLLNHLIPKAKEVLIAKGVDRDEVEFYLIEILHQRALNGQNGANWQKYFIDCHGKDFQGLTERYMELQMQGDPVHTWKI